jgi:hypothetical protein
MQSRVSEQLFELLLKAASDPMPSSLADGVYLFGQTVQNQESVLDAGQALLLEGVVKNILIAQTHARSGYPGYDVWKSELLSRDIPEDRIVGVPIEDELLLHTNNEANCVVRHCQALAYTSLVVTAPPFHQLRAFMSVVSSVMDLGSTLSVYSKIGAPLPWGETVIHSQGTLRGTRESFIYSEMERIERYHAKGDLRSATDVLEYLHKRDPRWQQ